MSFLNDDLNELKNTKTKVENKTVVKKINYIEVDEDKLTKINKNINIDDYDDFDKYKYPYSINFYDFEVFMCDWLVVIINPVEKTKKIICNDKNELKKYYNSHKNQIWCGYNSTSYDTIILKSILLDMNPKKINDMMIYHGMKGYEIDESFNDVQLFNFDIFNGKHSLKQLEAFMGNDIRETTIPFDIERPLKKSEILETVKYCMHDVEQTIEVFRRRIDEYNTQMDLIETFDLPLSCVSMTKARLTARIIGCRKQEHDDEFDLKLVKTLRLKKYKYVQDWFENSTNMSYKKFLETEVCGIPHTFGWGGLHGCIPEPINIKGKLFHVDVTSYYPSLMIEYDFLTRNCKDKSKFKQIYDKRVELKKQGKKKEQAPYKIVLNSTYGILKDKYSQAFDPQNANNVCVNGQLLLLDLLEHLEGKCRIIQSNTDGLIVQVEDDKTKIDEFMSICNEWISRTKMGLGFDEIDEIWQKDVNNYIFRFSNGKLERKGMFVMELNDLNNDLPIINEALVKYLTENIPVKETINNCDEMIKFQKIVKVSSNYICAWHNDEFLNDKTYRLFSSNNEKDSYFGKCKYQGATIEKFANTPEHCFIMNEEVKNLKVIDKLDKQWYIDLANDRLRQFGFSRKSDIYEFGLF